MITKHQELIKNVVTLPSREQTVNNFLSDGNVMHLILLPSDFSSSHTSLIVPTMNILTEKRGHGLEKYQSLHNCAELLHPQVFK